MNPHPSQKPLTARLKNLSNASGKLVIIGILAVAFAAAGASWWFRYAATHKIIRFWGPDIVELIRDARHVLLLRNPPPEISSLAQNEPARVGLYESVVKVSHAPGLLHLRNALLEDQSFSWPKPSDSFSSPVQDVGYWQLVFFDSRMNKNSTLIMFSKDCRQAVFLEPGSMGSSAVAISTEPIAAGLRTMFAEMWNSGSERLEPTR